jgi:peptidoglycan/LPS O-acetylase OafA/YrhL
MSAGLKYRPEIDGLRAIAVLSVIFFHASMPFFNGGYTGVDVFFVISGYLITTVILNDLSKGQFSLRGFYERRARRILPALFFILLACLPFSWTCMNLLERSEFFKSLVSVATFTSNILFWQETSYFAQNTHAIPLLHTWSLSLEEQFYLFFPVLMILVWKKGDKVLFIVKAALLLASLGLCAVASLYFPEANFYLLPSRLWELLIGALSAYYFYWDLPSRAPAFVKQYHSSLSLTGLLMILYSVFCLSEYTVFPSLLTLIPTLGTALIITFSHPEGFTGKLLSHPGLVQIGLISYSTYLWHQPIFAYARLARLADEENRLSLFGLSVLALVLGYLTWKFIERPFRDRQQFTPRFIFMASGLGLFLISFVFSGLHLQAERSLVSLKQRLSVNAGLDPDCGLDIDQAPRACQTAANPNILVWGDSFAMHLVRGILASDSQVRLRQATRGSCGPILDVSPIGEKRSRQWAADCIEWNHRILSWLKNNPGIRYVVLSSVFRPYLPPTRQILYQDQVIPANFELSLQKFRATLQTLVNLKVQPIIFAPPPTNGYNLGSCLAQAAYYNQQDQPGCAISYSAYQSQQSEVIRLLKRIEKEYPVIWLDKALCDTKNCKIEDQGTFMYRDFEHLSVEGSEYLGRKMDFSRLIQASGQIKK